MSSFQKSTLKPYCFFINMGQGCHKRGGRGGHIISTSLLRALPDFQTLRRPCGYKIMRFTKPVHICSHTYIFFTRLESNTFPPKKFKQLLKQINSPKCTKEGQFLTLFATEMVFSQKAVSDLHWKNIARTKHS